MTHKPEFVDNRQGNTLAQALRDHLDWAAEAYAQPLTLSIATGYFNLEGFRLIADHLDDLAHVRLLLGAEPQAEYALPKRKPGDPPGEAYQAGLVNRALKSFEHGLAEDRNLLGFTQEIEASLQYLVAFLRSDKIEVRRYEDSFLHGKAFIFGNEEGVIAGSSNLTRAGLTTNLELNLGRYDPTPVRLVNDWFNDLWRESQLFDLAGVYESRFEPHDPFLIYLRVLWALYGEELQTLHEDETGIPLTIFQNDGIRRAKWIMEKYNGVFIADAVGLGKSFIAGEIMRETREEHRQRVLLISPAALRDGTWARFQARYGFYFENVSYEQLALGDLDANTEEYSLVVIDEAQAFRNPNTDRALALRRLLSGTPPKKLVLLSATPVNNSLWDLYYLLSYFLDNDAAFADKGIPSLRERFKDAVSSDPYDLEPDMLFDILDSIAVRRTRQFIMNWYPHETIQLPDGSEIPISFPEPKVIRVDYSLENVLPGFFDFFKEALQPEDGEPKLTMARYIPSHPKYSHRIRPHHHEVALIGLLRSGLLKRFESSSHAFANTAERMAESHDHFLDVLDMGYIATSEALKLWGDLENGDGPIEWSETDNDEALEELLTDSGAISAAGYEVDQLREDVENDMILLRELGERARSVKLGEDPKLKALEQELLAILAQAEAEGATPDQKRNKRKVLIFSYFADTVAWIEDYLEQRIEANPGLAPYRGRIAAIASNSGRESISREAAVWGFAPISSEAPPNHDTDRFDILITTDVLAEGQNLQQAQHIINYDLPWNPMRLVQRNGRINRLASQHAYVYNRCIFPDQELDELLLLEERIRLKLAQAAASIGLESEVIPEGATSEKVFAETRQEIEQIRAGNAELLVLGGEEPRAHSGEEYRQLLRKGLETYQRSYLEDLPWAVGSGMQRGEKAGYFFCARVGDRVYLRFVPKDEGEIVQDTLGCLQSIDCTASTPRYLPEDLKSGVFEAWEKGQEDIYLTWKKATDPKNLQPKVRKLFLTDIPAHLHKFRPPDLSQEAFNRILDTIQAPRGLRIENQFRKIYKDEGLDPLEKSRQIIALIDELGLQPFRAPEPLPVIDKDEVRLVCWMVVEKEE